MGRPATISDQQILDAARQVFLEQGIRATTSEVARRAGVAEGSIFNRFATKADLFRSAMEAQMEDPAWARSLPGRVGKGNLRTHLIELGLDIVDFFRQKIPLQMMVWSNPSSPGTSATLPRTACLAIDQMTHYFAEEMRARRLPRLQPEVVARTFLGGLHSYVVFEVLGGASDAPALAAPAYVRGLAHLLLAGIAEPVRASARKRRASPSVRSATTR